MININNQNQALPADYWINTKYGMLSMVMPCCVSLDSSRKVAWTCDCGQETIARIVDVTSGKIKSCGKCQTISTCRCNSGNSIRTEIIDFIHSLNVDIDVKHQLYEYEYDLFIPVNNLFIECNGFCWHSPSNRFLNKEKYEIAINSGCQYIMIFEDEWLQNQLKVKALLRNRLSSNKFISIRPAKCSIQLIDSFQANQFYEQFHYIGKCNSKVSYGVFFQEKLIACISFSHPTRQSKHPWELIRMTSDPEYRVHGIWSKLVKKFTDEYKPSSLVSFSDNRLFDGRVYEKIGFKYDGEVVPDYYWTRNGNRYHKSGLRKTEEEKLTGLTETQLREAQGYTKVWDLGKKRWLIQY
jgi:hypothetical protein